MLRRDKEAILPKATCFINPKRRFSVQNATMDPVFIHSAEKSPISVTSAMKLHATSTQQYQTVTGYDSTGVDINNKRFSHSLIVLPEIAPVDWPVDSFDSLSEAHISQIDATAPDVVILGTGLKQRFIHPTLISALTDRRIGVECMDNQAACRTYNILMAEGRKVALALIIATPV